jgi:putative endonuclease
MFGASIRRRAQGAKQEAAACRYLEERGLTLLHRNFRCRHGEIDLVMRDDDILVFVEVRYRASERFGGAAASVDRGKQTRLSAAAGYYLVRHPTDSACRFDVVAIGADGRVHWIKHAFDGAFS